MENGMAKNILVIGGSYFAGRVFSLYAMGQGHSVTVMNRGHYSMAGAGVKELRCDRRDPAGLRSLQADPHYDAIVDFCAYEPGDIENIFSNLPCRFDQYLYISTPDVELPSPGMRTEDSPVFTSCPEGEIGLYSWKKLNLENELKNCSQTAGTAYTIIRPAFIFGPFNYAPRESWYVQNIVKNGRVPHPVDAGGKFHMVYVKDIARALVTCICDSRSHNRTYHVSAPDVLDYNTFVAALKAVANIDFQLVPVTVKDVLEQNIPLPFPLTEAENELFDGSRITRELGFTYSDFMENMKSTYNAFYNVYAGQ